MDYDKNLKPLVKTASIGAFGKDSYQQGNSNKAPIVRPMASKSAFGQNIQPTNKVTSSNSASLQKAAKLPGRVSMEAAEVSFN